MHDARRRQQLDDWFPTIVRYAGVALAIYTAIVHQFDRPSLAILAAGMIGFKTIWGAKNNGPKPNGSAA